MDVFGYAEKQVTEEGLLRMKEITISGSPAAIRKVAEFLLRAADEMETSVRFDHLHAQDECRSWDETWPDVIVVRGDGEKTI